MAKAHELDYNLPQLTVGEIAHVFGVSEQTVRFYHKKGLLVPDTRGDNAYRKYSWNKLSVLAQICFLRRAGFSIEDIKSYMQLDNLQDTHNYMEKFIEKLRQDAADIQRAIGILERKCSYLDTLQSQSVSEAARLATLPLRRYIYLGENDLTAANNEYFFDYPLITAYARSEDGLIHKSGLGAYLDTNAPPGDAEDVRVLPQQLCLVCNFRGSYDAVYTRIAELYRKHANLPLSRTAYAVNVVDHLVENNQNNYIVNIQIPVLDTQQYSTKADQ